jgi:CheY-like chemotaxis protein
VPGKGSTFTLYLPHTYAPARLPRKLAAGAAEPAAAVPAPTNGAPRLKEAPTDGPIAPEPELLPLIDEVGDDRNDIQPGHRVILIVENDLGFARFVLDSAREKGFKGLVTSLGAAALAMAREYKPDALTLDIYLPDIDGWRVLERLKNDVLTRHIPVCVVSTDDARERALNSGALTFVPKPIKTKETLDQLLVQLKVYIDRKQKSLLLVEPDPVRRDRIMECVGADDIQITTVPDGRSALQMLRERQIDCMVLNPQLADLEPSAFAESLLHEPSGGSLPVIVYGDGGLGHDEDGGWRRLAESCVLRRVHSSERLLDQAIFFLHHDLAKLSPSKRQLLENLHSSRNVLPGKKVLIVDDDMRNIFALSSILEEHDMMVVSADNGRDAIKILQNEPDIDVVLMDIMMPEMDGIETIREIRKLPLLNDLPIIAVTAKAMKGDREKCIEAGAWDYLSKPVDAEQMLAVLRAWLHR